MCLLSIAEFVLTLLATALSTVCILSIWIFVEEQRENWRQKKYIQQGAEIHKKYLQNRCKKELHRKEMEKYPLFFWKENIKYGDT